MSEIAVKPRIRVRAGSSAMRFGGSSRAYEGSSGTSQELVGWNPALGEANDESMPARDRLVSRSRDLVRNDPTAQGGIEKRVNVTVGTEMWVSARVNWKALGLKREVGEGLSRQFEAAWNRWAQDPWFYCDVEGVLDFGGLVELAYHHVAREDEAVAVIYAYEPGPLQKYATQVKIVDPDLLCNPMNQADTPYLRGGVETNRNGRPVAYHIQQQHPNAAVIDTAKAQRWSRVPRYTRVGRPQVIHYFGKTRAGMVRGVSKLAAGLSNFKQLSRYTQAEINAQLLAAMIPLFITSKTPGSVGEALAPAGDIDTDNMTARSEYHEESKITFNGVRIPALFDNESIESVDTKRTGADFAKFESSVLRRLAPMFGLTYEQLSNDWANVNYSSARAALLEIWRGIDADRKRFTRRFCMPIYQAVIWEAVVRGFVTLPAGAPDFVENLGDYTRCKFIGPGRGWVDPVKEAEAAGMRAGNNLTDWEAEAAEQGEDIFENMEINARVRDEARRLGLPEPGGVVATDRPAEAPEEPRGGQRQRQAA